MANVGVMTVAGSGVGAMTVAGSGVADVNVMAVARTTVPRAVTMSCMATAHNPKRHGREAGSSQEQKECVQIHVSIETVCWAVRPSTVCDESSCRYT